MSHRHEYRVIEALSRWILSEDAQIRREKSLAWGKAIFGGVLIGALVSLASDLGDGAFWAAIGAAVGGWFVGNSALHFSSYQHWPIIRKFIDADAVAEQHSHNDS